jgi:FdhD protein
MLPRLTQAQAALTQVVTVINEFGERLSASVPAERALTVYVDKRELVTLMTLGSSPELLVLGYLRNQRLINGLDAIDSITVDWDCGENGEGAAAVKTRGGIADLANRTAKKIVTTGCGQGSVFGGLMDDIDRIQLPNSSEALLKQSTLYQLTEAIRQQTSTYKSAGSVHGCALFMGAKLQLFVEDVGRHNALDTIAGWQWMQAASHPIQEQSDPLAPAIYYTTGRLTSEMMMKAAQMGVAIVVSRSGMTQMGLQIAQRLGMCALGRATNQHFICYCGEDRLLWDAVPQPPGIKAFEREHDRAHH